MDKAVVMCKMMEASTRNNAKAEKEVRVAWGMINQST